ncbi:MAG TPA: transposase [bacterium]|nr:transposase [bacterium]
MGRIARVVAPKCPHHVVQRGNNRGPVFFSDGDRRLYLAILASQCRRHGLALHAYCLMTNHVHLVATPRDPASLANAVGRAHWVYAQKLNRRLGRSGHLWQGRFHSCPMDDAYFLSAMAYVELNPVRAGICESPADYEWSTARAHLGLASPAAIAIDNARWERLTRPTGVDWSEYLSSFEPGLDLDHLRACTSRGLPAGHKSFVKRLERQTDLPLHPQPVGRPRRRKEIGEIGDSHLF